MPQPTKKLAICLMALAATLALFASLSAAARGLHEPEAAIIDRAADAAGRAASPR